MHINRMCILSRSIDTIHPMSSPKYIITVNISRKAGLAPWEETTREHSVRLRGQTASKGGRKRGFAKKRGLPGAASVPSIGPRRTHPKKIGGIPKGCRRFDCLTLTLERKTQ